MSTNERKLTKFLPISKVVDVSKLDELEYVVGNLRTLCEICNDFKNDLSEFDFFEKIIKITDRNSEL